VYKKIYKKKECIYQAFRNVFFVYIYNSYILDVCKHLNKKKELK